MKATSIFVSPVKNLRNLVSTVTIASFLIALVVTELAAQDNQELPGNVDKAVYPVIHGVVNDGEGNPVADATVIVQEHPYKARGISKDGSKRTHDDIRILARTRTAMDGEFRLEGISILDLDPYVDTPYPITLLILHEDFAASWRHLSIIPKQKLEFSLTPGKLVSFEPRSSSGERIEEIKVKLVGAMTVQDWNNVARYKNRGEPNRNIFAGLFASHAAPIFDRRIKQDKAGVRVDCIPSDHIAVLEVGAKNHVTEIFYLLSNDSASIAEQIKKNEKIETLNSPATVSLRVATSVTLKILDPENGTPVSDVEVTASQVRSRRWHELKFVSGADGQLKIENLDPRKQLAIGIQSPKGSDWLNYRSMLELDSDGAGQSLDIEMRQGIRINGTVVENSTGTGVPDVPVTFYLAQPGDSPYRSTIGTSNENGVFEIVVPEGQGRFSIAERIEKFKPYSGQLLDPALFKTDAGRSLVLKLEINPYFPKPVIQIRVVDQKGQPVRDAKVKFVGRLKSSGFGMPKTQKTDENGIVQEDLIQTLFQYRKLAMIAIGPDTKLAGTAVFERPKGVQTKEEIVSYVDRLLAERKGDDSALDKMDLVMEPLAMVRGHVIDADTGHPIAGTKIRFLQNPADGFNIAKNFFPLIETNEEGVYESKAIPNLRSYLSVEHRSYLKRTTIADDEFFVPMPGDSIELNEFRLVPKKVADDAKLLPFVAPQLADRKGIEAFAVLADQFTADQKEFRQRLNSTKDPAVEQQLMRRQYPVPAYIQRMLELADSYEGQPVEVKALAWACNAPIHSEEDVAPRYKLRSQIGDRLMRDHLESPEIASCLVSLIFSQKNPKSAAERIIESNPMKEIQGEALLTIARMMNRHLGPYGQRMSGSGWRKDLSDEEAEAEVHKAFSRIKDDYADVPYWRHENLGSIARMQLFELEHLGVGDSVEDITGTDLNDMRMQLSDFRGKFVVLDFWGSWCGPCLSDLPELNRIAADFSDRAVVVGVMNDSLEDAEKVVAKHGVKWRNWVEAERGPIQTRWNIDSWPTTYLIDPDGTILSKSLRGEKLYLKIEALVREERKKTEDQNAGHD